LKRRMQKKAAPHTWSAAFFSTDPLRWSHCPFSPP
jgi:hypothetical protein